MVSGMKNQIFHRIALEMGNIHNSLMWTLPKLKDLYEMNI